MSMRRRRPHSGGEQGDVRHLQHCAEDDGAISSEKAKRDLGFDAEFRAG
jgi:hypothetical protein